MQEKIGDFSEFSRRTEVLAAHLRKNLNDLPTLIGISPAMFYAYRTGKNDISTKAWRKLEITEREAGIAPKPLHDPPPRDYDAIATTLIRETEPDWKEMSPQEEEAFIRRNLPVIREMLRLLSRLK